MARSDHGGSQRGREEPVEFLQQDEERVRRERLAIASGPRQPLETECTLSSIVGTRGGDARARRRVTRLVHSLEIEGFARSGAVPQGPWLAH